jgi:hypothetical protein
VIFSVKYQPISLSLFVQKNFFTCFYISVGSVFALKTFVQNCTAHLHKTKLYTFLFFFDDDVREMLAFYDEGSIFPVPGK